VGRPLRRRYFELVLANGRNAVVFKDLVIVGWGLPESPATGPSGDVRAYSATARSRSGNRYPSAANRSRIERRTGIWPSAQSTRARPWGASAGSAMSGLEAVMI
jgi:hypothetical protein